MSTASRSQPALAILLTLACSAEPSQIPEPYEFELPEGLAPPTAPADNPTTRVEVQLGRELFFDRRLSASGDYSCASCHLPELAFTDGRPRSLGLYGQELPRGAPSLANVAYMTVYTWANPRLESLEAQALVPLLAKRPPELDVADRMEEVFARLSRDRRLSEAFESAFPGSQPALQVGNLVRALAAYERTLISADAPYDHFLAGDTAALSPSAERGRQLFFSSRLQCGECHSGRWLSDAADPENDAESFHNTGLYNLGGKGAYPYGNHGLAEFSGRPEDMGKFRTPSLRNVTVTAPYMHDGSLASLDQVLDHYAAGGLGLDDQGASPSERLPNPLADSRVRGFSLASSERADLLAFLDSLTDETFLTATASSSQGTTQ